MIGKKKIWVTENYPEDKTFYVKESRGIYLDEWKEEKLKYEAEEQYGVKKFRQRKDGKWTKRDYFASVNKLYSEYIDWGKWESINLEAIDAGK